MSSLQKKMKSILFLSYLLFNVKTWYWSTEFKVTNIVWIIKKIQHMIKTAEHITIIYTDHSAAVFIVQQFSLNTVNIKKLNLHLMWTSKYLQCFYLDVCYKSDKTNIILNVLFHLVSWDYQFELNKLSFNVLHTSIISIYTNNLVKISFKSHQYIFHDYFIEFCWQCIVNMIKWNDILDSEDTVTLLYTCIQNLLYYKNFEKSYQLCIFTYLYEEIFVLIHTDHLEYTWIHECLIDNLYLLNLLKYLHNFIQHCFQCQHIQTSQHRFYESMQSTLILLQSFYVLIINFILILLTIFDEYNIILLITDKFSKTITLVSEQKIMTTEKWVVKLMNHLALLN